MLCCIINVNVLCTILFIYDPVGNEWRKFKDLPYFEIKLTRMTWNCYHNICNLSNLCNHSLIRLHENNLCLVFLLFSKRLHCFVWFCFLVLPFFFLCMNDDKKARPSNYRVGFQAQMHLLFIQVQMQACCQNEKVISASLHAKNLDYSEYGNPNRILENNVLTPKLLTVLA